MPIARVLTVSIWFLTTLFAFRSWLPKDPPQRRVAMVMHAGFHRRFEWQQNRYFDQVPTMQRMRPIAIGAFVFALAGVAHAQGGNTSREYRLEHNPPPPPWTSNVVFLGSPLPFYPVPRRSGRAGKGRRHRGRASGPKRPQSTMPVSSPKKSVPGSLKRRTKSTVVVISRTPSNI